MAWETVVGLEIHAQLATESKIFSAAATAYGAPPNTQACAVDLGLPGVLPVLNEGAVRMAVAFGLAIDGQIALCSVFARKNYFYPDLPKGYQISQYELPIVAGGQVVIPLADGVAKTIAITRAHLEEDAGKSLHEDFHGLSGIDLNRAGTPLLEIVSEPDLRSAQEAAAYMRTLHTLVRYLGICDGNMQEGSFRADANVSIRPVGSNTLGTRTEIKNLNSFRFLERAIELEVERQIDVLEGGGQIVQETRLYDPDKDETRTMRLKEEANDYRYFPDPDLLPVVLAPAFIEEVAASLPELPEAKRRRYTTDYGLREEDADLLTQDPGTAQYFDALVAAAQGAPKLCANWLMGNLTAALNKEGLPLDQSPVSPELLAGLIRRIDDKTITGKIAKEVFEAIWAGEGEADTIIDARGLKPITDPGAIDVVVLEVIQNNPKQVEQFKAGKEKVLGFLVGQVMKDTQGKANPEQVNAALRAKLAE
ncbi:MAG: Asp-tRNA(Asn)/Glu-tRNA(Gln) amidotransferase subunit GatB [Candidatus Competibacterales bacterium]